MKKSVFALIIGLLAIGVSSQYVFAEDGEGKKEEKKKEREFRDRVWVKGKLVAIDAWLNEKYGSKTEGTLHSKGRLGFVKDDGTLWTIVDNTRGHKIATNKKLKNKEIKLYGWFYPKAQYVEFWKYSVQKGEKWVDWDYCKYCGFEPGDHKDTDFCEGCADE